MCRTTLTKEATFERNSEGRGNIQCLEGRVLGMGEKKNKSSSL
jgi:hypothetical protein